MIGIFATIPSPCDSEWNDYLTVYYTLWRPLLFRLYLLIDYSHLLSFFSGANNLKVFLFLVIVFFRAQVKVICCPGPTDHFHPFSALLLGLLK